MIDSRPDWFPCAEAFDDSDVAKKHRKELRLASRKEHLLPRGKVDCNDICIEGQGAVISCRVPGGLTDMKGKRLVSSKRGKITGFSPKSRRRFLSTVLKTDRKTWNEGWVFLTFTYGQFWPDEARAKQHLWAFLRRLERRFGIGAVCGFWRMEYQARGAVHFHAILHGLPYLPKNDLAQLWGEVIDPHYRDRSCNPSRPSWLIPFDDGSFAPFTGIQFIRGWRSLARYVGKYMAKPQDATQGGGARSAAPSGVAAPSGASGFIKATYLDATAKDMASVGRIWGVWQRSKIPWGDIRRCFLSLGPEFWKVQRWLRRVWSGVSHGPVGFMVYVEDGDGLLNRILENV